MRCQGHGYRTIVTRLNDEGVTPPGEHLFVGEDNPIRGNGLWTNTAVMRMTKNEAYIGHMVQFKTGNLSFKNRKLVSKPEDEWVRGENTHEPIVERAVWDMAQELASSKRKPRQMSDGGRNMYVGLLKCAECGSGLRAQLRRYKHKSSPETTAYQFICGTYAKNGKNACTIHAISENALTQIVLADIHANTALVSMDEELVKRELEKNLRTQTSTMLSANKQEMAALTSRCYFAQRMKNREEKAGEINRKM